MSLRPSDIPEDVVQALSTGTRASANLAESLALDPGTLLASAAPELDDALIEQMRAERASSYTKCLVLGGNMLLDRFGPGGVERFRSHPSDTVRGWAAYMVGLDETPLETKLEGIRVFADDDHFGVREWAWLGVRAAIVAEPNRAVELLEPWTASVSENVRRFATEATRPRGVWCAHIKPFKESPEQAACLLEPLRADPTKYVQDSVANWLNDASKTRADFVIATTDRWLREDESPATRRICKRARRSLKE